MANKKILVFGGSGGIGSELVRLLNNLDYEVFFTYFSNKQKSESLKGKSFYFDLTDLENPKNKEFLSFNFSKIDSIVTCSFPFKKTSFNLKSYEQYEKYLKGHLWIFDFGRKILKKGGKIINLLGPSAEKGYLDSPYYGASFAFIDNFSKSFNIKNGKKGICSIHNILLGPVKTSFYDSLSASEKKIYREKVVDLLSPLDVSKEILHIINSRIGPTRLIFDGFYSL